MVNSLHGGKRIVPQSSLKGLKRPKEGEIPGNKKAEKDCQEPKTEKIS